MHMVMNSTSNDLNTALILNGKVRVKIERKEKSTEKESKLWTTTEESLLLTCSRLGGKNI